MSRSFMLSGTFCREGGDIFEVKSPNEVGNDAGFHKCTYDDFLQDHTDIIFLKYNHSAELVNTQLDSSKHTPIREGAGLWGGQILSFYSSHFAKLQN